MPTDHRFDWSKTNAELAAEHFLSIKTIIIYRKAAQPDPMASLEDTYEEFPEYRTWVELIESGRIRGYIESDFDRAREFKPLAGWSNSLLMQTDCVIRHLAQAIRRRRIAVARSNPKYQQAEPDWSI